MLLILSTKQIYEHLFIIIFLFRFVCLYNN